MEKYLYLTCPEWTDAWVNGGKIPLNLASAYKSVGRDGIYTPDENVILSCTHDLEKLSPSVSIQVDGNARMRNVSIGKIIQDGKQIAKNVHLDELANEDGVILSLCNRKSNSIAQRLKKRAAVKILDVDDLKAVIDEQLGKESIAESCKYTSDHNRNHFLKSVDDEWQDEFRLFWVQQERVEVELPKGMAKRIKIKV